MALISGLQRTLHDLAMNLAVWAILLLAIPLVTHRAIAGIYLAFLVFVVMGSFEAVQPLGQAFQFLGRTVAAAERLFEIVDATPQVSDEDACQACDCGRMANAGHCGAMTCATAGAPMRAPRWRTIGTAMPASRPQSAGFALPARGVPAQSQAGRSSNKPT